MEEEQKTEKQVMLAMLNDRWSSHSGLKVYRFRGRKIRASSAEAAILFYKNAFGWPSIDYDTSIPFFSIRGNKILASSEELAKKAYRLTYGRRRLRLSELKNTECGACELARRCAKRAALGPLHAAASGFYW